MYWKLWFVLIRTQILRQVIYYLMGIISMYSISVMTMETKCILYFIIRQSNSGPATASSRMARSVTVTCSLPAVSSAGIR